jgi:hypothetical protein
MTSKGSRGGGIPPSGNPTPPPAPPSREPDPLGDAGATDGVQPADRGHLDIPPSGGAR